ncbi:MAG: pyridoxamine 5'-phosphate oxidase [Dehalococcoidia bacterium]|uniref:pyridoxamine 5'-phosphate oxidase n=1 Tax=Candidatus Amarobacter glycogenicus TaxID=3140699 RepID=UPI002A1108A4|nr:pyridoxamine 5'-phosphate oxidase [Dehalococcoidia bacterium]MBK7330052.1 pyridoxamine 5'-phosphate oxidase [Dehalococcoidia bacterium]MBK9610146.1 pyridoxamine 5'-phosphate oxidase [Dehalococcoidia bacterium]
MARWADLEAAAPEISGGGRKIIYQHGPGLAYLATVRADDGLRIHPFCPVITGGGIYGLINNSPKRRDLTANGRYAIHSFPLEDRDDEFMLAGIAKRVTDPAEVIAVKKAYDEAGATSGEDEWTFEFSIERALLSVYNPRDSGLPLWPPRYLSWRRR